MSVTKNCCCHWGAAVKGEYPEFDCRLCEVHQNGLGSSDHLCKRHLRTETSNLETKQQQNLETLNQSARFSTDEWTDKEIELAAIMSTMEPLNRFHPSYSLGVVRALMHNEQAQQLITDLRSVTEQ